MLAVLPYGKAVVLVLSVCCNSRSNSLHSYVKRNVTLERVPTALPVHRPGTFHAITTIHLYKLRLRPQTPPHTHTHTHVDGKTTDAGYDTSTTFRRRYLYQVQNFHIFIFCRDGPG
jgi:hypothetical protein